MQPLHVAVLNENAETVAVLLRLGADPLGTCPDCYPSYASWKRRRGIQAMQVAAAVDAERLLAT
jgi:ankyrin repeat protein